MGKSEYPPIADYGYIADCHSCALVSKSGSIDWCCMPRIDSASCFGRLLDWERGGYCRIAPPVEFTSHRKYLEGTLVLETTFETQEGAVRLIDCFTMREGGQHQPYRQLLRVVEGIKGRVQVHLDLVARFDYGAVKPWIRRLNDTVYSAVGGSNGLLISGDFEFRMQHRSHLVGTQLLQADERRYVSILSRRPEDLEEEFVEVPEVEELERRLQQTIKWWRDWSGGGKVLDRHFEPARRSAIVLKGLSNAPTGAIAAAATTSLPEAPGGARNWDYRFSWIRDSSFTSGSLAELGHINEADGFRRFIERSAAGGADQLQVLFGVGGERRLHEVEIDALEGYRGAKPVRVGNGAWRQTQLDAYGQLLNLAWEWHGRGRTPDIDYWEFLKDLVDTACDSWKNPDSGMWEMRGKPRHFVHSKVMCWAAVDRGIRLAEDIGCEAPVDVWKKTRDEIRRAVEDRGYDKGRGVFVQAFDHPSMDSALLLLPSVGFVDYSDERMIRTTDAVREDLQEGGLLRRYAPHDDGMEGKEGVFLACSFWLVLCLARQDRLDEAHRVFKRTLSTGNDLGLFSEEYDTESGEMLGNFPQGLTHISLIEAAVALDEMDRQRLERSG